LIFDSAGKQIAFPRKMHLFDIDVEGGQKFKESDTFTAGNSDTTFETPFGKIGFCFCFDLGFVELA
jgi:predicted amidohydrolase